jgi:CHASE2 domain-containing sensor protein
MKDMRAHLEKLRAQAAECEVIRDLATDEAKRELFERLAKHHKVLADHVEQAMAEARAAGGKNP